VTLLDDLERDARWRAQELKAQGKLTPGFCERHYPFSDADQAECKRLRHAAAAAPDADTFVALAKGLSVDITRLTPEHAKAYRR
jgi:hypothetical protein